jgi:hypothetical protein
VQKAITLNVGAEQTLNPTLQAGNFNDVVVRWAFHPAAMFSCGWNSKFVHFHTAGPLRKKGLLVCYFTGA